MYQSDFCEVRYLKDENSILCTWKQFCSGDVYRDPFKFGLELVHKKEATTWITDTTNGFENEDADTTWLLEIFMPQIVKSSIETIIFIIKRDSPLIDEIEGQTAALSEFFDVKLVESLDDTFK